MLEMLLIQGIGGIGYGTLSLSYFKKEKKQILFMEIISYICFTIHFYLLNGMTGAICNLIGFFSLVTIYLSDKYKIRNKFIIPIFFVGLILIINVLTFQNIFSVFPMIASTIVILSFLGTNENIIRGVGVISALSWLIYAIVYKSYISIVFEVVTLAGVCIAFFYNKKNNKVKE
ncbi:MAG: YgjV family protein [Clostridia bacterium]|nr:YgjV family protein [Clostridia bacterium]